MKSHLARYERFAGGWKRTSKIRVGGHSLHTATRQLYVEDWEVELKNGEYELLLFFCSTSDIVFSREELYEKIWGLWEKTLPWPSISTACGRGLGRTLPDHGTTRRPGAQVTGSGNNRIVGGMMSMC